ncbi:MAG: alpha/beta fold hydrolase [Candidatus Pacebacteria bacterium]|nr:alpha/beta fold hydrolase [Candidatus Paceibacterota bacterium]
MENKFQIKNRKDQKIIGILSIPQNPIGLGVIQHGLGGFKEQKHMTSIAETLLNHGYVVVNFDATNSIGESEGNYEQATMQNHYDDLVDVIAWAKTQEWYQEPFVLVGHSLGGYTVARYAEDYPNEVKGVFPHALVVAGELSYKAAEKFESANLKSWEETGWKTEESKSKPGVVKSLPWSHMEERFKHDLRPNAHKLTMPVLFVVGEKDIHCPPIDQQALCDLVAGPKEMHVIVGARHTFKESEHLVQLKDIFGKWLEKIK